MAERIFTREDAKSLIRANTKSVRLPSDFTTIGNGSLAGFSQVSDLVIPEGVKRIASFAFYMRSFKNTSGIATLTIPSSLQQFDRWCFYDLNALTNINLPEDFPEQLAVDLFFHCPSATLNFGKKLNIGKKVLFASKSVTVQELLDKRSGILSLGAASLLKVESDGTLAIPSTYTAVLPHALRGVANKGVKKVIVPTSVRTISGNAFSFLNEMEELVLEDGIEYIDSCAFAGCKSLKKITIPESVTEIGVGAFMNLPKLEYIKLPAGLKEIPDELFSGCVSLKKVRFGGKITKIGAGAFAGCTAIQTMMLPESVKSIGNSAFWECTAMQRMYIPAGCESVTQSSLGNCPVLSALYMPRIIHDQHETKRVFGDLTNPTITWLDEGTPRPDWNEDDVLPDVSQIAAEEIPEVPVGVPTALPSDVRIQSAFSQQAPKSTVAGATVDADAVRKIEQAIAAMQSQISALTQTSGESVTVSAEDTVAIKQMQKNLSEMQATFDAAQKLQDSAETLETLQKQLNDFETMQQNMKQLQTMQASVNARVNDLAEMQEKVEAITQMQEKVEVISELQDKVEAIGDVQQMADEFSEIKEKVEAISDMQETVESLQDIQETVSALTDVQEKLEAINDAQETVEAISDVREKVDVISELKQKVEEISDIQEKVAALSGIQEKVDAISDVQEKVEAIADVQEKVSVIPELQQKIEALSEAQAAAASGVPAVGTAEPAAAEPQAAPAAEQTPVSIDEDAAIPFVSVHQGEYPADTAVFTHEISKPMPGPVERSAALKNYSVIAYRSFRGAEGGERFEIPEGVRRVETQAFWDCPRLMALEIPNSLTEIEPDAFAGCSRLTDVYLPADYPDRKAVDLFLYRPEIKLHWAKKKILSRPRVATVAELMEQYDDILTAQKAKKLTVRNRVLEIPEGYTAIAPNFAKDIDIRADEPEHTLATVILPKSLRRVAAYAFAGMESVRHIIIPEGLRLVEMNAFTGCLGPFRLVLPDSVEFIGAFAFAAPCQYEQIRLPKTIRTLPENAFSNCNTLVSLRIPESVETVGDMALSGCSNLSILTIPQRFEEQLPAILDGPVKINVNWSKEDADDVLPEPTAAFRSVVEPRFAPAPEQRQFTLDSSRACSNFNERLKEMRQHPIIAPYALSEMSNQTKFEIPLGVLRLGSYSFGVNQRLMTLTVPKALTEFDYAAFYGCTRLRDVFLPDEFSRDMAAVLFMNEPSILVYFGNARPVRVRQLTSDCPWILTSGDAAELDADSDGTILVPDHFCVAASYMYHGVIGKHTMRRILFQSSMRLIGSHAFVRLQSLEAVICLDGLQAVEPEAFVECAGLRRVVFPASLRFLGTRPFVGCVDLEEIVLPKRFADRASEILRECPKAQIRWIDDAETPEAAASVPEKAPESVAAPAIPAVEPVDVPETVAEKSAIVVDDEPVAVSADAIETEPEIEVPAEEPEAEAEPELVPDVTEEPVADAVEVEPEIEASVEEYEAEPEIAPELIEEPVADTFEVEPEIEVSAEEPEAEPEIIPDLTEEPVADVVEVEPEIEVSAEEPEAEAEPEIVSDLPEEPVADAVEVEPEIETSVEEYEAEPEIVSDLAEEPVADAVEAEPEIEASVEESEAGPEISPELIEEPVADAVEVEPEIEAPAEEPEAEAAELDQLSDLANALFTSVSELEPVAEMPQEIDVPDPADPDDALPVLSDFEAVAEQTSEVSAWRKHNFDEVALASLESMAGQTETPAAKKPVTQYDVPADGKFTAKERRKCYHDDPVLEIPAGYLEVRPGACAGLDSLETVVLPDTIVKIGSGAFSDSSSLRSVLIPLSVRDIAEDAFEGCDALATVTMPRVLEWLAPELFGTHVEITWLEEQPAAASDPIAIGDGRYTRQIRKEHYHEEPKLVIPEGFTEIRPGACAGLENLQEVVLPSTLTKICSGAFAECSSLAMVDIPASVTELDEDAFEDCDALRTVVIPSHLKKQAELCFPHAELIVMD